MNKKNQSLTRTELHMMNLLWEKGTASVQQLHDELPEPKPPYTTTLSVMQVLTKKGIVTFDKEGRTNIYRPLLNREDYLDSFVDDAKENLFGGSIVNLFSFFAKREKLSKEEMQEILEEMNDPLPSSPRGGE